MGSPLLACSRITFHMNIERRRLKRASAVRARASARSRGHSNRLAPGGDIWISPDPIRVAANRLSRIPVGEILPHPNPQAAARQAVEHLRALSSASILEGGTREN